MEEDGDAVGLAGRRCLGQHAQKHESTSRHPLIFFSDYSCALFAVVVIYLTASQ